ncbi:hypothetical protein TNCT_607271 [Trichonephila clavata]|uniref:Uncharacterized protein n=1 Tax=Trichonephila clavata TaxID=2740835 RepID=A0A8X6LYT7_TRICU|nr:hypothetical protein TNCT_607271 [Trichonephila clavata]
MMYAVVVLSLFLGVLGSPNEEDIVYVPQFRSPRPVLLLTTTVAGITNPATEFAAINSVSPTEMQVATEPVPFPCETSTPCGWLMYQTSGLDRINREFVKSPCFCTNDTQCTHHRENIRIEAYEYRCKPITLTTTNSTGEV